LVRAITPDTDTGFDAGKWKDATRRYRRLLGMALERKNSNSNSQASRKTNLRRGMNEAEALAAMKEFEFHRRFTRNTSRNGLMKGVIFSGVFQEGRFQ